MGYYYPPAAGGGGGPATQIEDSLGNIFTISPLTNGEVLKVVGANIESDLAGTTLTIDGDHYLVTANPADGAGVIDRVPAP